VADEIEEDIRTALRQQKEESEHFKQEIEALNQRKKLLEEQKGSPEQTEERITSGYS